LSSSPSDCSPLYQCVLFISIIPDSSTVPGTEWVSQTMLYSLYLISVYFWQYHCLFPGMHSISSNSPLLFIFSHNTFNSIKVLVHYICLHVFSASLMAGEGT
jgi:hypothetical protein